MRFEQNNNLIKIPACSSQILVICIFSENNDYQSYIMSSLTILGVTLFYCTQQQLKIRNSAYHNSQRKLSASQFIVQKQSEKKISLWDDDFYMPSNTIILDENLDVEYIASEINDCICCSTFLDEIKVMKVDKTTKKNFSHEIKDLSLRQLILICFSLGKKEKIVILNTNTLKFEYIIIKIHFQLTKVIIEFIDVKDYAKHIKKHSCFALMNKLFQSFSHEFGTLLNQIALTAQFAIIQFPEQNAQFEQIDICCSIMNNMVKDLKDFHYLRSKTFKLEIISVDIDGIFEELKKLFVQQANFKQINLYFQNNIKGQFKQDEQRIKQILQNLLQNAIKYTGQNGSIWMVAEKQDERYIKFSIMDSGIGINEVEASNIRQLLSNDLVLTQQISQGAAGLGIGLLNSNYLIKHLNYSRKQKNKQNLQFTSEEQNGTHFWFLVERFELAESPTSSSIYQSKTKQIKRINKNLYYTNMQSNNIPIPPQLNKFASCPAQIFQQRQVSFKIQKKHYQQIDIIIQNDQNQNIEEPIPNQIPQTQRFVPSYSGPDCVHPQILLVDDEAFNLKILQQLIKHLGYNTELANSGQQAINLINQRAQSHCQIKLILMDINMPHMNGIETTKIIKKNYPNIVVLGCSAFSDIETKYKAQQAGMENYIEKPIAKKRLQEMFRQYL